MSVKRRKVLYKKLCFYKKGSVEVFMSGSNGETVRDVSGLL